MRGVGRNQHYRDEVLDNMVWLRENGYRHASRRQIAERLGLSLKALEKHIARGRKDGDPRVSVAA